ncbi:MAG: type II toxin-antitoxin system Phd/YefM family antitoxin [Chloroflexota bacterium]|nr:type II toxin-antitoxin system Phd/YefM family antitoxin [Chloroflexota bacterium]
MRKQEIITQTMNVSEARKQRSKLVNTVAGKQARVLVEKSGAPMAAIVSADDLRGLEQIDAQRQLGSAVLEEIGRAFADVPKGERGREIGQALASVRSEQQTAKPW